MGLGWVGIELGPGLGLKLTWGGGGLNSSIARSSARSNLSLRIVSAIIGKWYDRIGA